MEYDDNEKLAFGFTNLNDPQNAELGYISIKELMDLKIVTRDVHYTPKTIKEIKNSL